MTPSRMLFSAGLLVAVNSLSLASPIVGQPSPTTADQSLMRYMMRSTLSKDPGTSVKCFEYFIPILNHVTEELSKNYQLCTANEKAQIDALNDHANSDRYQIELAADGICVRLDACNDYDMPLDFFDCFAIQGKANSRILYTVTQNSTSIGAELREQYHIAEVERIKCQNASERSYVERTAITYQALDDCLQTGVVPAADPVTTISTTVGSPSSGNVETTIAIVQNGATTLSTEKETEPTSPKLPPPTDLLPSGRDPNIMSRLRKLWSN